MPDLSRAAIRCALANLVIGLGLGAAIGAYKGLGWPAEAWNVLSLHIELMLFGWTVQFALAVAYWIIPRIHGGRPKSGLAVSAFVLLNAGAWTAGLSPALGGPALLTWSGKLAEALAVTLFAFHAWPRIRPPGPVPLRPKAPTAPAP